MRGKMEKLERTVVELRESQERTAAELCESQERGFAQLAAALAGIQASLGTLVVSNSHFFGNGHGRGLGEGHRADGVEAPGRASREEGSGSKKRKRDGNLAFPGAPFGSTLGSGSAAPISTKDPSAAGDPSPSLASSSRTRPTLPTPPTYPPSHIHPLLPTSSQTIPRARKRPLFAKSSNLCSTRFVSGSKPATALPTQPTTLPRSTPSRTFSRNGTMGAWA